MHWKHLEISSISDELRETYFEMVWTCPTQANNCVDDKSFSMQVKLPMKKKGQAKEDKDGSS